MSTAPRYQVSAEHYRGTATEAQWQATVVEMARHYGYRVYHTFDSRRSTAGYPDLTIVGTSPKGRPRCIFAELKSERGKLSAAQEEWLDLLKQSGQEVYVWRPSQWDEIEKALQDEL